MSLMNTPFGQYLKDHWFIFAAIVAIAAAWGTNTAQLANATNQVDKNAAAIEAVKKDIGEINQSITKIETNQANEKEDVAEIKSLLLRLYDKIEERGN